MNTRTDPRAAACGALGGLCSHPRSHLSPAPRPGHPAAPRRNPAGHHRPRPRSSGPARAGAASRPARRPRHARRCSSSSCAAAQPAAPARTPGPAAALHPAEPARDPGCQLTEHAQPAARFTLWPAATARSSRAGTTRDDQTVAVLRPAPPRHIPPIRNRPCRIFATVEAYRDGFNVAPEPPDLSSDLRRDVPQKGTPVRQLRAGRPAWLPVALPQKVRDLSARRVPLR
jgi:hypothetical protein